MKPDHEPDQRFQDLLEGRSSSPSAELEGMAALASALRANAVHARPSDPFRRRLRSELLAAASSSEEETFAAAIEHEMLDAPADVRQLVAVASALEPAHRPSPDPAFRFQLRRQLIEQASGASATSFRTWMAQTNDRMRKSFRAVAALTMGAVMMAGSGAALAAAQSAVPGDALYGIKRVHESIQLFGVSGSDEGELRLDLASRRLDEIETLVSRGVTDEGLYLGALDTMDRFTTTGTAIMLDVFESTGQRSVIESLASFALDQEARFTDLVDQLPPGVRPAALDSLSVIRMTKQQAEIALLGCDVCPSNPFFAPPTASGTVDGVGARCACELVDRSDEGSDQAPDQDTPIFTPTPPPPPEGDRPAVNLPDDLPDEVEQPGEDVIDDVVDDLLDDLLDGVEDTLPPLPTPPGLPDPPVQSAPDLGL